jgi:hypothetical protein
MLILVEGPPGAGKSSTARHLRDVLSVAGRPVRWWSEEELGHPVYVFRDDAELKECLTDLTAGGYKEVVEAALDRWRAFAEGLCASETAIILDGCLSIYLTYTLLFFDVPEREIAAYVEEVARIIAPCDPRVILLRPADLARDLAAVCAARGEEWSGRHIGQTERSPYGQRLGVKGFEGYVSFWADHRALTDRLFDAMPFDRVIVPGPAEDWPTTRAAVADFLSLDQGAIETYDVDLGEFTGRYVDQDAESGAVCTVVREQEVLVIVGLTWFGERCRMVRRGPCSFNLESFPTEATFRLDDQGRPQEMTLSGPDLLFGRSGAPRSFVRVNDR